MQHASGCCRLATKPVNGSALRSPRRARRAEVSAHEPVAIKRMRREAVDVDGNGSQDDGKSCCEHGDQTATRRHVILTLTDNAGDTEHRTCRREARACRPADDRIDELGRARRHDDHHGDEKDTRLATDRMVVIERALAPCGLLTRLASVSALEPTPAAVIPAAAPIAGNGARRRRVGDSRGVRRRRATSALRAWPQPNGHGNEPAR